MTTTTMSTKKIHESKIETLNKDSYGAGTYNLETMETVEFDKGYQVTFCQVGDNYSDDDYEFLVAMFTEISSDGNVYAGKFDGTPEISFHVNNRELAIRFAKMFNQVSVWDWSKGDEIITGGTGKR